jgi:putative flippase GtrA
VSARRTLGRFAAVGVVNTLLDTSLFLLLHPRLGVVGANFVSTSAGMAFSFLANGVFTFGAGRPTPRQALTFLATTGTTMWLVQPVVIGGLLDVLGPLTAKLMAIGVGVVLNFAAYRWVVWPERTASSPGLARAAVAQQPDVEPGRLQIQKVAGSPLT